MPPSADVVLVWKNGACERSTDPEGDLLACRTWEEAVADEPLAIWPRRPRRRGRVVVVRVIGPDAYSSLGPVAYRYGSLSPAARRELGLADAVQLPGRFHRHRRRRMAGK